jgi:CRISPR system Cascade subunit CasE
MIVSLLTLKSEDIKKLKITDTYSIHRVVYDLFEDIRTEDEKKASVPSGILYVDKGGDSNKKEILILSNRHPKKANFGSIKSQVISDTFLAHEFYHFEVLINPTKRDSKTKKLIPIRGRDEITKWFIEKAPTSWGFVVNNESFSVEEIHVNTFNKSKDLVTQSNAKITGQFKVVDRELFISSFKKGMGRGRAFGLGLLQIIPLIN